MKANRIILALLLFPAALQGQETAWLGQESGIETDLIEVFAVDSLHVWAAGEGGTLLHTTDGGITWENSTIPYTAKCMHFFDTQKGIIAGASSQVLLTADGGTSWNLLPTGVLASYTGMSFTDSLNGWLTGNGNQVIVRTRDGGLTWQDLSIGNSERFLIDIGFADTSKGWLLCRNYDLPHLHHIMMTSDGGNTWTTRYTWPYNPDYIIYQFHDLCVADSLNIWISGYMREYYFIDGGVVWNSSNGGVDWDWYVGDYYSVFYSIHFPDADHGWVTGSKRIFHLYPPEQETYLQYEDPADYFACIHFADSLHGWAAGTNGAIVHTASGGIVGMKDKTYRKRETIWLYPNPCTSNLFCKSGKPLSNTMVFIRDISGRVVLERHFPYATEIPEINTSGLVPGIYIFQLANPEGPSLYQKFIVQ